MTETMAVRARGLHERYGPVNALAGIDLDIAYSEVVALVGPNGAGKTSTVEILEGYRDRDAGEATVLGEDPWRAGRAWRSRIGIVLQDAADLSELTVGMAVRLVHRADAVVLEVRDDGHGFVADDPPGYGLGGMRGRLGRVDGTLTVFSAPVRATTIRAEVPVTTAMAAGLLEP